MRVSALHLPQLDASIISLSVLPLKIPQITFSSLAPFTDFLGFGATV